MNTSTSPDDAVATCTGPERIAGLLAVNAVNSFNPFIKILSSIEELPPELKLQIMSDIPARDCQRLRGVCTTFRAVVDEHEGVISQTSVILSLARLDHFIKTHIDYVAKTASGESGFMKALTAFIELRGLVMPSLCFEWLGILEQFLCNWRRTLAVANRLEKEVMAEQRQRTKERFSVQTEKLTYENDSLQPAVFNLIRLHFHYHVKEYAMESFTEIREEWMSITPKFVGLESAPQMEQILDDIEKGAWAAAPLFPECPVVSCSVDAPPSPYGIYPEFVMDFLNRNELQDDSDMDDGRQEEVERNTHEREEQDAVMADDVEGWNVAGPSRRDWKKTLSSPIEPALRRHLHEHRKGFSGERKKSFDEFLDPLLCSDYGIDHNSRYPETLEMKFQRLLGVPGLTEGMPFRYFVKSARVYSMLVQALHGGVLTPLKKAAIHEELHVY